MPKVPAGESGRSARLRCRYCQVVTNTGTAEYKRRLVAEFDHNDRKVVFAAGDADSELPIVEEPDLCIFSPKLRPLVGRAADRGATSDEASDVDALIKPVD